jgi:hypothetical protein
MSFHLKKYLVYRNILLLNNQYGGAKDTGNHNQKVIEEDKELKDFSPEQSKDFFPEQLKNSFVNDFNADEIIWMDKINTLYVATKNQKLIYKTSILDHKIIYVLLKNENKYSMILENNDTNYSKFFKKIDIKSDFIVILTLSNKYISINLEKKEYDKTIEIIEYYMNLKEEDESYNISDVESIKNIIDYPMYKKLKDRIIMNISENLNPNETLTNEEMIKEIEYYILSISKIE